MYNNRTVSDTKYIHNLAMFPKLYMSPPIHVVRVIPQEELFWPFHCNSFHDMSLRHPTYNHGRLE